MSSVTIFLFEQITRKKEYVLFDSKNIFVYDIRTISISNINYHVDRANNNVYRF